MCEKCQEIDVKVARYRRLLNAITDRLAIEGLKAAIRDLESEKVVLHPKPET